jgi:hypothetical protein
MSPNFVRYSPEVETFDPKLDYIAKVRVATAAENAGTVIHHQLDLNSGPDVFGPVLVDE